MGSPAIKKLLGQRLNEDTDSEGNKHSPETDFQGIWKLKVRVLWKHLEHLDASTSQGIWNRKHKKLRICLKWRGFSMRTSRRTTEGYTLSLKVTRNIQLTPNHSFPTQEPIRTISWFKSWHWEKKKQEELLRI